MKSIVTAALLSILVVSCSKSNNKRNNSEENTNQIVNTVSGYKCDLVSETEQKDVFMNVQKSDVSTTVTFHDMMDGNKVASTASLDGFQISSFSMSEGKDVVTTSGESALTHTDAASLSVFGKVKMITGRFEMNNTMTGSLSYKLLIEKEDSSVRSTDFKDLASVENCQAFEASL